MEKLRIIKTLQELAEIKEYLEDKQYVAYDTETTGVKKESIIIGFSVSADADTGFYVVLAYWDIEQQKIVYLETMEGVKEILEILKAKDLIMHNAIFDCWMTENNFQVSLIESVHTDTMILAHLLDENRHVGLKELGTAIFGEDARKEQKDMQASVAKNGGMLTKACYELYKADSELIGKYGAKDAILTIKLFYTLVPELYDQNLDQFFYEDECMPLLKGPTYDMNTTGLKVDPDKLQTLKNTLETECLEAKSFIYSEIDPLVKHKYPGTGKTNVFNIGSSKQLSWLMFEVLGEEFNTLTPAGKEICKSLDIKTPYSKAAKRQFIQTLKQNYDRIYKASGYDYKKRKATKPKKIGHYWNYLSCGKPTLTKYSEKYKWVAKFLEYAKNKKLLNTYVEGIQEKMQYGIIRPSFLQHGTTSGRYSSRQPNFQNLPRDDKRVKACIISRPNKVFVGADYSQLEPRIFASFSADKRLIECFKKGDDFYSVIGAEVFEKQECSLKKDDPNSFAKLNPKLRDVSKVIALSATYGTLATKMAPLINKSIDEAQEVLDDYFDKFPSVKKFMLESHSLIKEHGFVLNLFGRPRRMPKAKEINQIFGSKRHAEIPYDYRKMLNLAVNHRIQSTAASIMNRAAIACWKECKRRAAEDATWHQVRVLMQVHDELILEGPESLKMQMYEVLKRSMEQTSTLPGVALIADPKIANNLAELK